GLSPISRDISEIRDLANGSSTVVVEVRKEGYIPKSVVVTDIDSLTDVKLNLEMASIQDFIAGSDPNMGEAQKRVLSSIYEKQNLQTNRLIDDLFEAQRLTQVGRTDDAEKKLDDLEKNFPNVASVHEIRGGIAFMKKQYARALDSFRKAARSNPDNIEVLNLKKYLEKKLKIDNQQPEEDRL
ncbi:MAG: tetratricopeptide repeat protein, partial [Pseudomonadota bacterium]